MRGVDLSLLVGYFVKKAVSDVAYCRMKGEQHGHRVCKDWKEAVVMKYPCFPLGRLEETTTFLNLDIWQADRYSVRLI